MTRMGTYCRDYLEGMTALYNAETASEGHIAPMTPERFVAFVERKSAFDPSGVFVALEGGEVVGWAHACVAAGTEPWQDPQKAVPRIRMLLFPPNRLKVGEILVSEATRWLRQFGGEEFEAFHCKTGYPFYRGLWMGGEPMCSANFAHVQLVLEVGGYKNTHESVFMTAEMDAMPPEILPTAAVELVESPAQMRHEPMRDSWVGFEPMRIRALIGEEEVGHCGWVLLPQVAERLGAPCVNIWSLGVREVHRRKGIAAALSARAMAAGYALGARFASVGTQLWNAPAHATYAKLGFRPHCVLVGRALRNDERKGRYD